MGSPHVAVVAFPFSSHAPKLLAVARALATAAPSTTFSFLSTAASLDRLRASVAAVPENLRFVEVPTGVRDDGGDDTPAWRRMELFVLAAEAGGLKQSLKAARAAEPGASKVSCVVGDAFMSMAADAGVPWVAVWTGNPCVLLAHLHGDALRKDLGDHAASRGDELLTSHVGLGSFRVRDQTFRRRQPHRRHAPRHGPPPQPHGGEATPRRHGRGAQRVPEPLPAGALRRHRRRATHQPRPRTRTIPPPPWRGGHGRRPPRLPRLARRPAGTRRRVRQLRHGGRAAAGRAPRARRRARGHRRAVPVVSERRVMAAAPAGVPGPRRHGGQGLWRPRRAVGTAGRRAAAPGGGRVRGALRLGIGRRGDLRWGAHGVPPLLRRPADERPCRGGAVGVWCVVRREPPADDTRRRGGGGGGAARRGRSGQTEGKGSGAERQGGRGVHARRRIHEQLPQACRDSLCSCAPA